MYSFTERNVNTMTPIVIKALLDEGVIDDSRNGAVLRFDTPVCLEFTSPLERVCFDHIRDCNHFFHFMEALWMLAGRRDVAFLNFYSSGIKQFSDDGIVFNAAYGYRMRSHFGGVDQLLAVCHMLKGNTKSRQAVIALWDPNDINKDTKDKACNLSLVFSINKKGEVDLTVFNRSNDMILGALCGANTVHMSFFLQFVAEFLGRPVGVYRQISNNMHLYTDHPKSKAMLELIDRGEMMGDLYPSLPKQVVPLLNNPIEKWLADVETFTNMAGAPIIIGNKFNNSFFDSVAVPMHNAFATWKMKGSTDDVGGWIKNIHHADWRSGCMTWVINRGIKK